MFLSRFDVAGENKPEQMIQVPVEPSTSSTITYTNKFNPANLEMGMPNAEQMKEATPAAKQAYQAYMSYLPNSQTYTKYRQGEEPWWMKSENAPRADITHSFGSYAIQPTRNPLTSTDKAVGILPFPEAYEPWKYSMARPYVVETPKVNQYNYTKFHMAKPYSVMVNSENKKRISVK